MSDMAPAPEGRHTRRGGDSASWMIGVVLILLGAAFMLERAGYLALTGNWWAIFVYLAAFASFANVWRSQRAAGRFTSGTTASLVWGLVLTVVATILMFGLSWDVWWPAILVAVGVGIVAGYLLGDRERHERG